MNRVSMWQLMNEPRSLSRNLFGRMVGVICLGIILIVWVAGTQVSHRINTQFDRGLASGAQLLSNLMEEELQQIGQAGRRGGVPPLQTSLLSAEDRKAFDDYADWRMFRIWYDGHLTLHSTTGPPLAAASQPFVTGFETIGSGKNRWRVYTLVTPRGNPVVQVGERLDVRQKQVVQIATELAAPFIVIAGLMLLVVWFSIRRGLIDLDRFSFFLSTQNERPPFAVLPAKDWPVELSHLISVINGLFSRIETSVLHERKFIDMAAHQLRTPLSGLSIEAQLCTRIKDPDILDAHLSRLLSAAHRVSGLVDQLLTLAQIDALAPEVKQSISAREVLSTVIADMAPIAARRDMEMAMDGPDFFLVGSGMAVELLISNLLDNAIKYGPDGSDILVRLSVDEAKSLGRIEMSDSGPGMSAEDRQQAFERFWQASKGRSPGAGLGLAIAREAANSLNGELSLHNRPFGTQGLLVRFEVSIISAKKVAELAL